MSFSIEVITLHWCKYYDRFNVSIILPMWSLTIVNNDLVAGSLMDHRCQHQREPKHWIFAC